MTILYDAERSTKVSFEVGTDCGLCVPPGRADQLVGQQSQSGILERYLPQEWHTFCRVVQGMHEFFAAQLSSFTL